MELNVKNQATDSKQCAKFHFFLMYSSRGCCRLQWQKKKMYEKREKHRGCLHRFAAGSQVIIIIVNISVSVALTGTSRCSGPNNNNHNSDNNHNNSIDNNNKHNNFNIVIPPDCAWGLTLKSNNNTRANPNRVLTTVGAWALIIINIAVSKTEASVAELSITILPCVVLPISYCKLNLMFHLSSKYRILNGS